MAKIKHKLQRTQPYGYTVIAYIGKRQNMSKNNSNLTTKPVTRQKKKRFGIFKKEVGKYYEY